MTAGAQRVPFLAPTRRSFLLRRLHGLSGVFPVGAFLVEHLWTNAKAVKGQAAFDQAVGEINSLPLLPLLEIFGIFLPLAFHALYGVKLALDSRPNLTRYAYSRNAFYTLQRVTGLIAFAFIVWHLWEFRVPKLLGRMSAGEFYPTLEAHLSSNYGGFPALAVVYLVGLAASVVHFANGLLTFSFAWGICVTRRSQRLFGTAFGVLGLVVFLLGADTIFHFAAGTSLSTLAGLHSSSTTPQCSVVDPPPRPAGPPKNPAP